MRVQNFIQLSAAVRELTLVY